MWNYKWMDGIIATIVGFAMVVIVFVSAFEIACYSDYGFYQKEYEKYEVIQENSIVNMEMSELMRVTKEMMAYLKGNREDLVIYAEIDGSQKEMFNEIDKSHMADVQELFLIGLNARMLCLGIAGIGIAFLLFNKGKQEGFLCIYNGMKRAIFCMLYIVALIAVLAIINFDKMFVLMHLMLFDNDNWLLDPAISRLINILPEGFFMDMGVRILIIYVILNFFIFSLAFCIKRGMIKKNKQNYASKLTGGTDE